MTSTMAHAAAADSSTDLEEEIRQLEQELERKKLEDQIRQLEEQLQAVQATREEQAAAEKAKAAAAAVVVPLVPLASAHSAAESSVAAWSDVGPSAHSVATFESGEEGGDIHEDNEEVEEEDEEDSDVEYEDMFVEVFEGSDGVEYEEIVEYIDESDYSEDEGEEYTEVETSRADEEASVIQETPASMLGKETAEVVEEEEKPVLPPPAPTRLDTPAPSTEPKKAPWARKPTPAPVEEAPVVPIIEEEAPAVPVPAPKPAGRMGSVIMPTKKKVNRFGNAKTTPAPAPKMTTTFKKRTVTTPAPIIAATAAPEAAPEKDLAKAPESTPEKTPEKKQKRGFFRRVKKTKADKDKAAVAATTTEETTTKDGKKVKRTRRVIRKRLPAGQDAKAAAGPPKTPCPSPAVTKNVKTAKPFVQRVIPNVPASAQGEETPLELLLGPKLCTSNRLETASTLAAIKDRSLIALYFGANWQKESKRFVPMLLDFYKAVSADEKIEAVYVSVDRTIMEFKDIFAKMPFLAMPTGTSEIKNDMAEKLKVVGMPALVVLDAKTGHVVTTTGVSEIQELPAKDGAAALALAQKWKQTKATPMSEMEMEAGQKRDSLERGTVYWQL